MFKGIFFFVNFGLKRQFYYMYSETYIVGAVTKIANLEVSNHSNQSILTLIQNYTNQKNNFQSISIMTMNFQFVAESLNSDKIHDLLMSYSDIITADGIIVVWLANFRKKVKFIQDRCTGSDVTRLLFEHSVVDEVIVIGADKHDVLREKYPEVEVIGFDGIVDLNNELFLKKLDTFLNKNQAPLILLALNFKKQIEINKFLKENYQNRIIIGVGASIDFLTGKQKRAPLIWQKLSLEWLYRLFKDPKRLSSRYLIDYPIGIYKLCRYSLKQMFLKKRAK